MHRETTRTTDPSGKSISLSARSISAVLVAFLGFIVASGVVPSFAQASDDSLRFSVDEISQTDTYWTQPRITEAIENPVPLLGAVVADRSYPYSGAPFGVSSALRHRPVKPKDRNPAIGKLFMRYLGVKVHCSGTLIKTRSLRLVLTAAHCLQLSGIWSTHVTFVPDYRNGRRPYGTYSSKALWITGNWARHPHFPSLNFDLGIVKLRKRAGKRTGAVRYKTFPGRSGKTHIYGYPSGAMRGQKLCVCTSRTWEGPGYSARSLGPTGMAARCNMASGSSGGPWISHSKKGARYLHGITSASPRSNRRKFSSPYLGKKLRALIHKAENN